jgi:hypothetical protein
VTLCCRGSTRETFRYVEDRRPKRLGGIFSCGARAPRPGVHDCPPPRTGSAPYSRPHTRDLSAGLPTLSLVRTRYEPPCLLMTGLHNLHRNRYRDERRRGSTLEIDAGRTAAKARGTADSLDDPAEVLVGRLVSDEAHAALESLQEEFPQGGRSRRPAGPALRRGSRRPWGPDRDDPVAFVRGGGCSQNACGSMRSRTATSVCEDQSELRSLPQVDLVRSRRPRRRNDGKGAPPRGIPHGADPSETRSSELGRYCGSACSPSWLQRASGRGFSLGSEGKGLRLPAGGSCGSACARLLPRSRPASSRWSRFRSPVPVSRRSTNGRSLATSASRASTAASSNRCAPTWSISGQRDSASEAGGGDGLREAAAINGLRRWSAGRRGRLPPALEVSGTAGRGRPRTEGPAFLHRGELNFCIRRMGDHMCIPATRMPLQLFEARMAVSTTRS